MKQSSDNEIRNVTIFRRFAKRTSEYAGTSWVFSTAFFIIVFWALSGPLFGFSDRWQLVINTSTTIVTFLMVFLIQNTQNREAEATQLKLDEIIRAISAASNDLIDLEDMSDKELARLEKKYRLLREKRFGGG